MNSDTSPSEPIPEYFQDLKLSPHLQELITSLPSDENWFRSPCYLYEGFWYDPRHLVGMITCQDHFQAWDADILLVSCLKSGTTWLKALAFAVLKRTNFPDLDHHPLHTHNPHQLVPCIEYDYVDQTSPDFEKFGHPRLLASHLPSTSLPRSAITGNCKIVYVCRNPKDVCVSLWHFVTKLELAGRRGISLDEAVTKFTKGLAMPGPYWDHVLGFWKMSLENPKRVLFLRYEEMKENPLEVVKKLSEFFGCPFSPEEEVAGVAEKIVNLCSFGHLSNLDVNKYGKIPWGIPNASFFRRGEVGGSVNYMSPENAKLIDQVTAEKVAGSGLVL